MSQEQAREERAFEALVVEASRRIDEAEVCIDNIREPHETELAALRLLGTDFINRLVSGTLEQKPAEPEVEDRELAMAGEGGSWELFRCDGVDDVVNEELRKADEEIIKRKKGKKDGEAS
jgi:hypothetical protein